VPNVKLVELEIRGTGEAGDESLLASQPGADTFLVRHAPQCPVTNLNATFDQTIVLYGLLMGFEECFSLLQRQMVLKRAKI